MKLIHMSVGGPDFTIQVNGKRIRFEFHPYCGPIAIKKTGEAKKVQPHAFLEAASLWAQQGKKVGEDGLCIWFREPREMVQHLGGKHYSFLGYEPAERGH